jgi:hypothetical protein
MGIVAVAPFATNGGTVVTSCQQDRDRTPNKFEHKCRYALKVPIRPPILDGDCLPFDMVRIFQSLTECGHKARVGLGFPSMDKSHYWNWLLCGRRKRPCSRGTANQCDEFAALHVPPK